MLSAILFLGLIFPEVQAHQMLEDPKDTGWVSKADALGMENPRIRDALKRQSKNRKLDTDFDIKMWDEDEMGAWVLALHIARQEVREQREKAKPKKRVID